MPRIQEEIHQCSTSTYRIVPTLERASQAISPDYATFTYRADAHISNPNGLPRPFSPWVVCVRTNAVYPVSNPNGLPKPFSLVFVVALSRKISDCFKPERASQAI